MTAPQIGANLEHLVLTKSSQFFKSYPQSQSHHTSNREEDEEELIMPDDEHSLCNRKWCWWTPPQGSTPVGFCHDASIHGFKYMGQSKRHLTERLFWLVAFFLSFAGAIYLIYGVWDRYEKLPVIVSFQSNEQDIESIPFPAVTLCNMNMFPKSKVHELEQIAQNKSGEGYLLAKQQLTYVRSVCNARQSFAKIFRYAFARGEMGEDADNDTIIEENQDEMMEFLLSNTLPCDQLIRLCVLGEMERNCSDLFKPIVTDYGRCCVFNILPLPLLLKNPQTKNDPHASIYDNPVLGSAPTAEFYWPRDEIKEWGKWNYDDGFVLPMESTRPWKQKRSGMPYGLSILVDPNLDEYFCPVSDSEGVRYILHTPLEMPHVMEFSSVADLGKEILIEVHPDMTNADDDIRYIEHEKRKCYFGKDQTLNLFGPYTGGNCLDECTAMIIGDKCNCTYFFMPRDDGVRICNNDPDSADFACIANAKIDLQSALKEKCSHCDALCEDIAYNYETTFARLQSSSHLWGDIDPAKHVYGPPAWAEHKMSVIHIFFGSDTTVPKYRKRLYGVTDLIANIGGILGLCLGFSILSGIEVIYFLTLRPFCKYCRRRQMEGGNSDSSPRNSLKFINIFNRNRVIRFDPNSLPVYKKGYGGTSHPNGADSDAGNCW